MSRLRATLVLLSFVSVTLHLMPVQQLLVWFWPRMARKFPMYFHRVVLRILGIRVKVDGAVLSGGPALLVSNHVSWLDIVILSAVAPVSFIAKRDVSGWPFFGTLAHLQRTVFVDRNRRHTAGASRNEMQVGSRREICSSCSPKEPRGTAHGCCRSRPPSLPRQSILQFQFSHSALSIQAIATCR